MSISLAPKRGEPSAQARANANATWRKCLDAPGFDGPFVQWWAKRSLQPPLTDYGDGSDVPANVALQAFSTMQDEFRKFEKALIAHRVKSARQQRAQNMKHVFADCRAPGPLPVDTLSDRVSAEIDYVDHDESAVVLVAPVTFAETKPVIGVGKPRHIIAQCEDKVWLDDVADLDEGQILAQETAASSDQDIIARREAVWEPRWNKFSHLEPSQWEQINGFADRVLAPVCWNFKPWAGDTTKKETAAVGPDGVSKQDVVALPVQGHDAIANMFQSVESGNAWPAQLATGFVSSLAKCSDASGPDQYRPITIYSLIYRLWSTARSREALHSLETSLPSSVQGGCPLRQAKNIWYSLAHELEHSHLHGH